MIKIEHKNISEFEFRYKTKLLSTKYNGETIEENYNNFRKKYSLALPLLDKVIFAKPEDLCNIASSIDFEIKPKSNYSEIKKELAGIFDYIGKFQPFVAEFFEENLNPRVCYYCNIDFINVYESSKTDSRNKFTIDHFFKKSAYPYFALSLYNLVPCCYVCNSKIKNSIPLNPAHNPHSKDFDFDEVVKFKLYLNKKCETLHIKSKDDIEVKLKEDFSSRYDDYIKKMRLNERYSAHTDIVFSMIEKAERYPKSRLDELHSITGIDRETIKRDIFDLVDDSDDSSQKPFSKLIKDISREISLNTELH